MEKIKIFHNPQCSKSRCALEFMNENKIEFEVIDYIKNPPSEKELIEILQLLNIKAEELIRKNEAIYKEQFKGKTLTEEQWISAMVKFPKLIERPIVINGNKAVVARPTELINNII